jgi:hypothetical protein
MNIDFKKFQGQLPYASELYGVYQPLLGWKGKRNGSRLNSIRDRVTISFLAATSTRINPVFNINDSRNPLEITFDAGIGKPSAASSATTFFPGSFLTSEIAKITADRKSNTEDINAFFSKLLSGDELQVLLKNITGSLKQAYESEYQRLHAADPGTTQQLAHQFLNDLLSRESVAAGTLQTLAAQKQFGILQDIFFPKQVDMALSPLLNMRDMLDPLEAFDPAQDIARICLSPIGIVNLFRQYFFEFDSFLGPSVQHIWLSPGGTVELVEISTRKTTIERTMESAFEDIKKTDKETVAQDELSDAVKQDNESSTKFGVSAQAESGALAK